MSKTIETDLPLLFKLQSVSETKERDPFELRPRCLDRCHLIQYKAFQEMSTQQDVSSVGIGTKEKRLAFHLFLVCTHGFVEWYWNKNCLKLRSSPTPGFPPLLHGI